MRSLDILKSCSIISLPVTYPYERARYSIFCGILLFLRNQQIISSEPLFFSKDWLFSRCRDGSSFSFGKCIPSSTEFSSVPDGRDKTSVSFIKSKWTLIKVADALICRKSLKCLTLVWRFQLRLFRDTIFWLCIVLSSTYNVEQAVRSG